ncbi:hypothetical protein C1645_761603, partial [Glomus cerebriforme]
TIDTNDFEVFLKNSQNIFIKKLLICNEIKNFNFELFISRYYDEGILPFIEKYVMEKKRIEYLAYKDDVNMLKDKVKRLESYNIKVRDYNVLNICYFKYIEETY